MIDRMRGVSPGLATSSTWLRLHGEPTLVVPGASEGVWLRGPGRALTRRTPSSESPIVGTVEPRWRHNAIRLVVEPAHGPRLHTDGFEREDIGGGTSELSRLAQLSIDVNGTYRAVLRTDDGREVGWMRVAVGLHQPSHAMYEADLPPEVDAGLAVAIVEALGAEIDWIEGHAYDVYGLAPP